MEHRRHHPGPRRGTQTCSMRVGISEAPSSHDLEAYENSQWIIQLPVINERRPLAHNDRLNMCGVALSHSIS